MNHNSIPNIGAASKLMQNSPAQPSIYCQTYTPIVIAFKYSLIWKAVRVRYPKVNDHLELLLPLAGYRKDKQTMAKIDCRRISYHSVAPCGRMTWIFMYKWIKYSHTYVFFFILGIRRYRYKYNSKSTFVKIPIIV